MKIKQIDLIGFKSFSEKATFPLHNGITCIVGPNGCGKSNIVDAFRWVLGEQSAKSLRSERMDEVIFQGSATKKPKAMAEVSLEILFYSLKDPTSNGDEQEQDKIILTRRLYRSGESEYLLNKRACRLKDIRDILLDTGLDVRSYSILDQQRIADIIHSKPQERRFLIEEIAGVMKYKVRRAEAESKLESSRENLVRITDLLIERKKQVGSLERQAKKAERYKKISSQLAETETRISKFKHLNIDNELSEIEKVLETKKHDEISINSEISSLENEIQKMRIEISEIQRLQSETEQKLHTDERLLSSHEKRIAILKTNIENREIDINKLEERLKSNEIKREEALQRLQSLEKQYTDVKTSLEDITKQDEKQAQAISTFNKNLSEKEAEAERLRRDMFRLSEQLSNKKNDYHKMLSHIENLDYKEEVSLRDKESITKTLTISQENIKKNDLLLKNQNEKLEALKVQKMNLISNISELTRQTDELKADVSLQKQGLAADISRLKSIREIALGSDMKIFSHDSIKDIKKLSDVINVDKEYEKVVESVFYEYLDAFLIDNETEILEIINEVHKRDAPRTNIMYVNKKDYMISAEPTPHGVITRLSDIISVEGNKILDNSVKYIMSKFYLVENIDKAFEIHKANKDINLVTPKGEVLTSTGLVIAGKGREILKLKREIKELEKSIKDREQRILEIQESIDKLILEISQSKETLSYTDKSLNEIDKDISITKHRLNEDTNDLNRRQKRLESIDIELISILSEREDLQKDIDLITEEINQYESDRQKLQEGIMTMQKEIAQLREEITKQKEIETNLKLQSVSLKERLESISREKTSLKKLIGDIDNNSQYLSTQIHEARISNQNDSNEIVETNGMISDLVTKIRENQAIYDNSKETVNLKSDLIDEIAKKIKNISKDLDIVKSVILELNQNIFEKRLIKKSLEEQIREKYGIDLNDVVSDTDVTDDDYRRLSELQDKIKEIGPVSLEVIDEYEQLKKEYDFLQNQKDDLEQSIVELQEAIARINNTTKRRLREAYNLLKEKFDEVFKELFGGGKADLMLQDENNILETGIEIFAQPPGKKNQNLNQLSGGEKALTSIALLFAGFLIKPSPLCILDEADAPLDETNTYRFSSMIKKLSKDTQFIIITHNRITMEVADYIYGVTMEEPGVSKHLSLQFSDVEKAVN